MKYESADTLAEARSLLSTHSNSVIVAGGQTLLPSLRRDESSVDCLVDISNVDGWEYIEADGDEVRIGCLARYADIVASDVVTECCPGLSDAVAEVGDRQVRNRGTFCGGVAAARQRGDPPALSLATDATVVTQGGRYIGASELLETESSIHDDVIEEIRIPADGRRLVHERYTPTDGAYPIAIVSISTTDHGSEFVDPRVVVSGVEPPRRLRAVESWLAGRPRDSETAAALADRVASTVEPTDDFEGTPAFKSTIIKTLTRRAVDTLADERGALAHV